MEHCFSTKKLEDPIRVGFRLKQAREAANISLEELASRTKVSKQHLCMLESCNFEHLPFAPIYRQHFICAYCKALDLEPTSFLHQYKREECALPETPDTSPSKKRYSQFTPVDKLFTHLPTIFRGIIIMVIAGFIGGYLLFHVQHIISAPSMTLSTPEDGFVTTNTFIILQGTVDVGAEVYINGVPIAHTEQGTFQERIILSEGVNTINVEAKKKHGNSTVITRHVIVESEPQISLR